jgi:hypothetical protein
MLAQPFEYKNDKKHSFEKALFIGGMFTFTDGGFCASSKTDILFFFRVLLERHLILIFIYFCFVFFSVLLPRLLRTSTKTSIPL